jgi:hypothetical protein
MVAVCPNKSHPDWKAIVSKHGEDVAWAAYISNGEVIPSVAYVDDHLAMLSMTTDSAEETGRRARRNVALQLRAQIESYLNRLGVGVGVLSPVERASGIEGVHDPSVQRQVGQHLVELARVASGDPGTVALPEIYASVVIEGMRDRALYKRLHDLLDRDDKLLQAVIERDEEGSYERYRDLHAGDREGLVRVAMSKLVARHLLNREVVNRYPAAGQHLVGKFITDAARAWSAVHYTKLAADLAAVDSAFDTFVTDLAGGLVQVNITASTATRQQKLYKASRSLAMAHRLTKAILDTGEHSYRLAKARVGQVVPRDFTWNKDVLSAHENAMYITGAIQGLEVMTKDTGTLITRVKNVKEQYTKGHLPARELAHVLREALQVIRGNEIILEDTRDFLASIEGDNLDASDKAPLLLLHETVSTLQVLVDDMKGSYRATVMPLLTSFFKNYLGSMAGEEFDGETVTAATIERWLTEASKDISFIDRFFFAAVESGSPILRLMHKVVAREREKARVDVRAVVKKMQKMQEDFENAGHGSTGFMYERDKDGKLTGYFLSSLNVGQYFADLKKIEEEEKKRYGIPADIPIQLLYAENRLLETRKRVDNPDGKGFDAADVRRELAMISNKNLEAFMKAYHVRVKPLRTFKEGVGFIPSKKEYSNAAYDAMTPAQKAFHDDIIKIKRQLDANLPSYSRFDVGYLAPQVHKTLNEHLKASENAVDMASRIKRRVQDKWRSLLEETDIGTRSTMNNLDGTRHEFLPVRMRDKLDNMEDLSTDVVSSMAKYAFMAVNYEKMNSVIDLLEVAREYMKDNMQVNARSRGDVSRGTRTRTGKLLNMTSLVPRGQTRLLSRLADFFTMEVYGYTRKNENVGRLNTTKLADNMMMLTALNSYALNALAGISNVVTGTVMMSIDAMSREHFSVADMAWADKQYGASLPGIMSDLGRRRPRDKFSLMMEKFNVLQDHEKAMKDLRMNQRNMVSRNFRMSALFFLSNCGEHFMQTRTFLALAHRYKLVDRQGQEVNLWDAFEVKKDADGIEQLVLKPGLTRPGGKPFDADSVFAIEEKSKRINEKLHGIYNNEDMAALQQYAVGRLVFMYRKWVVPSWNRRYQKRQFDFALDQFNEGFYVSGARFLNLLWEDLRSFRFHAFTRFNSMTPHERANVRRCLTEVLTFVGVLLAYAFLFNDDDDDETYANSLLRYELRRLRREMGALMPTPLIATEAYGILSSPSAVVDFTMNAIDAIFSFDRMGEEVQSGPFKGLDKYLRGWIRVLPLVNPIKKMIDPDEALKYFNFRK